MNKHLDLPTCLPFAQRDAWESLGNRFSGEHAKLNLQDLWSLAGVVMAGIALVWLLRWLYQRQQARQLSCDPRHLFADLCRAHRVSHSDRRRLEHLANHHQLGVSAELFVRPDLFDPPCLPEDEYDIRSVAAFEGLRRKLFAGLEEEQLNSRGQSVERATDDPAAVAVPDIADVGDAPEAVTQPVS